MTHQDKPDHSFKLPFNCSREAKEDWEFAFLDEQDRAVDEMVDWFKTLTPREQSKFLDPIAFEINDLEKKNREHRNKHNGI